MLDAQGNGKAYYLRPSPYFHHQQVSEYAKINAVMYKSSVHRKKNRKPSAEEKDRRQQQQAKDRAASAAAVVAAKQLLKEKAALDAEKRKAHRQAQISKSKVEKEKKSAIAKDARSKTYAEAAQTSPPCASPAVSSTTSAPTSTSPGKVSSICAVRATSSPSASASASAQSSLASSSLGKATVPVQLASMTEATVEPPVVSHPDLRCPSVILGWPVIFKDLTTDPHLNGEPGFVEHSARCNGVERFRVRVDSPTVPHKKVQCVFSNLIPVRPGEKDAAHLEKRLTALLAASSGLFMGGS